MNNNFFIIILIIASDNHDYYINMQNIWKLYMNNHPHIKSFFIKENMNIDEELEVDESNSTINVKCEPSLIPGVLIKTIKCLKYIYDNYEFKYIFRTNLSSFLDLHKLYNFSQNNNFDYAAVIGNHNNINYGSGSGFFLSKQCVHYLINKNDINYYKDFDDVLIGEMLTNVYSIVPVGRVDIYDFDTEIGNHDVINSHVFHFRLKNGDNMHRTVYNLQKMYQLIYN
jgi:hypothetical protein